MVVPKLAVSNFTAHKVRVALTVAAIALSVSLVVSVTSGYASIEASIYKMLSHFMGTADAMITHKGDSHGDVPESVVWDLKKDPDVQRVTGRLEAESSLVDSKGQPLEGHPAQIIGIRRPDDTRVESLDVKSGDWFDSATGTDAVIDEVAAERLNVKVGGKFTLPGVGQSLVFKVVGIVQKPRILASHIQSIYIPLETLQKFAEPGKPPAVNRVMIDLKSSANIDAFVARWTPKLTAIDPSLNLRLARDNRKELDTNLQGVHILSFFGGTVSMLAATFIVFSALSMGVSERSRTLAMLRAIGAERNQIAALVVVEGLLLAGVGVIVGIPAGWLWVKLLAIKFNHLFTAGVVVEWKGVLLGGVGSLLAALAASLLPAWSATRVQPLEAMVPQAQPASARLPALCAIIGVILIGIDPLLMYGPWERWLAASSSNPVQAARIVQVYGHFVLGIPSLMLGFFLVSPTFVWVLERVAGPIVAAMMGLRFAILRQQLSSGIWRAAGTCAALMVGLAILVAMETEGTTLIRGWHIPDKFPDIFIVSWLSGLNDQQVDKLAHVKGIVPGDLMPIAIASPEFGGGSMFALGAAATMPDATMFFGIDPVQGLRMLELEFREGNAADATRMLQEGRHIIVTDEFRQMKHLGVGDKLPLQTKHGIIDYTIAGVVSSPGMDVIVSMFDMGRQFDQRTAASIFGSLHDAKEDFGADSIRLFAANLQPSVDKDKVLKEVQNQLGVMGLVGGDVRQIKAGIQTAFSNILLLMTTVPFAAMAVASLGVANTIMASIRSRRWQLGVLRSVGLTRSQLLRLVLSEAILVGIVGCGLGLCAGFIMAANARQEARVVVGYIAPVAVPWAIIFVGTGAVMVVSVLASLWPAISVARSEPLTLLQAGRAAA
jgi:putative ABC transport system permease protein